MVAEKKDAHCVQGFLVIDIILFQQSPTQNDKPNDRNENGYLTHQFVNENVLGQTGSIFLVGGLKRDMV